jgi:hypothetical protein
MAGASRIHTFVRVQLHREIAVDRFSNRLAASLIADRHREADLWRRATGVPNHVDDHPSSASWTAIAARLRAAVTSRTGMRPAAR